MNTTRKGVAVWKQHDYSQHFLLSVNEWIFIVKCSSEYKDVRLVCYCPIIFSTLPLKFKWVLSGWPLLHYQWSYSVKHMWFTEINFTICIAPFITIIRALVPVTLEFVTACLPLLNMQLPPAVSDFVWVWKYKSKRYSNCIPEREGNL